MKDLKKFKITAPRNIALETYSDGSVKQGYIDGTIKIRGIKYCTEIAFWPDGSVRAGRIDGTGKVNRIECAGFIYFYPAGKLLSCRLVDTLQIGGILFKGGQYVDFDEYGQPKAGYTAADQSIKGVKIPGERFIRLDRSGKPTIADIDDLRGDWSVLIDNMNYECALTSSEFVCGSYSGGGRFGEWGTSRTFREFIQGELQDFPGNYMPDDFNLIMSRAEMIHQRISEVEIYTFNTSQAKKEDVPDFGILLKNFSWYEGYDGEYEFSVSVYRNFIRWHMEYDEQWSGTPEDAVQKIEDYLQYGPPDYFKNRRCNDEILNFVRNSVQQ